MRDVKWPYGWGRVGYSWEDRKDWLEIPFPVGEYESRITRVRAEMARRDLDVVVVHGVKGADRGGIRYLSNFEDYYTGDSFVVIPAVGEPTFITDAVMHGEPMHSGIQAVWMRDVRAAPHPRTVDYETTTVIDHLCDTISEAGAERGRVGVAGMYSGGIHTAVQQRFDRVQTVPARDILDRIMARKSDAEVALMRRVASMSDAAMTAAMKVANPGVSEREMAAEANYAMYLCGAETAAFPLSACGGPRAGFKHAVPTDRRLEAGDIAFTDLGGQLEGYCSDTARGRVVGDSPTDEQRSFLEAQIAIVDETIAMVKPGVQIGDLAARAEDMAREFGLQDTFYFRGHGIGTHTHIYPSFVPGSEVQLEKNMTFCYEPMFVATGFGTACVEDMYVVTEDGCETLSQSPRRWWN